MSMSTSTSAVISTRAPPTNTSTSLLERLPPEIRLEIYRYLVGKYAKFEHRIKSKKYDENRQEILEGGDFAFEFHVGIFGVNKMIRREALDVFQHEYTFVRMSPCVWGSDEDSRDCIQRISQVVYGPRARTFPKVDLDFVLQASVGIGPDGLNHGGEPFEESVIFPVEELGEACAAFQVETSTGDVDMLHIRVRSKLAAIPSLRLEKVLSPIWDIRGVASVSIHGLKDTTIFDAKLASMYKQRPTPAQTMHTIAAKVKSVSLALGNDQHQQTINVYKEVLNILEGNLPNRLEDKDDEILRGGIFHGMGVNKARNNMRIQAHTRIASAYLHLEQPRIARIYIDRTCRHLYRSTYEDDFDDPGQKFPLQCLEGSPSEYAELLTIAAQISHSHGHFREAVNELKESKRLDPENRQIHSLLKDYKKEKAELHAKKYAHKARRIKKLCAESEAGLQVCLQRVLAAERFLQSRDKVKARYKHNAAAEKAEFLLRKSNLTSRRMFGLFVRLSVVANTLGEYNDAIKWADRAIGCFYPWNWNESEGDDDEEDEVNSEDEETSGEDEGDERENKNTNKIEKITKEDDGDDSTSRTLLGVAFSEKVTALEKLQGTKVAIQYLERCFRGYHRFDENVYKLLRERLAFLRRTLFWNRWLGRERVVRRLDLTLVE